MKHKYLFLFFLIFFIAIHDVKAQSHDTIRTGRPGQGIGPYVVGFGYLQIQSGVDYYANENNATQSQALNNVIRYGVSERFELSALVNLQRDKFSAPNLIDLEGLSELHLGFRYNLNDHPDGWIPGFGIQTRFRTTMTSSDYRTDNLAPILVFVTHHRLSGAMALGHNFGVSYDGITSVPSYTFLSNLSFSLTQSWGSFIEVYGDVKNNYGRVLADTGLSYLINNDLQLDSSLGWSNNNGVSDFFVSVGVSWRLQTQKDNY